MMRHFLSWFLSGSTLLAAISVRADKVEDYLKIEMADHRIPGVALIEGVAKVCVTNTGTDGCVRNYRVWHCG